jgi:tetratricopeptide (TPR) repeat protein
MFGTPLTDPRDPGVAAQPLGSSGELTTAGKEPPPATAAPDAPLPAIPGYELLEVLGRGGMGVVYKARHLSLQRTVALKVIISGGHAGPDERARFRTEAQAMARLQHSGIVQIYEVGEHDGLPFLALEFCPGGSLKTRLQGGPLPARQAAALVQELAAAMQAAHDKGVVHRDLNPANVLLAEAGIPKVTDFGLARQLDDVGLTQTGAILGTPSYMAPEQAAGDRKRISPSADVYALGALLYECLTGRPPFRAASTLETLRQVLVEEPARPALLQPGVPRDLETICMKCLRKEPKQRYSSAADLEEDLECWQAGRPIRARRVRAVERGWRWCQRNPVLAAVSGLAATALLAVIVVSVCLAVSQSSAAARLAAALSESQENRRQAQAYAAASAFERAQNHWGDQKEEALLWLARSLELAPAEAKTLQGEIRESLADALRWEFGVRGTERQSAEFEHGGRITHTSRSPDDQTIVTSSADRTARLWDATTRRLLQTLQGHQDTVLVAAFSPDGRMILTGSADRTARLWEAATGRLLATLVGHPRAVGQVGWSPDGKVVVTVSGYSFVGMRAEARLWQAATGQPIGSPLHHQGTLVTVAFSADGTGVLTWGKDKAVRRWDAATGQALGEPLPFLDATDWRTSVAFSPDGRFVLVGKKDKTAVLWDLSYGKPSGGPVAHGSPVAAVAFSMDGKRFVTVSRQDMKVWDTASRQPLRLSAWRNGGLNVRYYSPDQGQIYVRESDGSESAYTTDWFADHPELYLSNQLLGAVSNAEPSARALSSMDTTLQGGTSELRLWAEVLSRKVLDPSDKVQPLDEAAWQQKRRQLQEHVRQSGLSGDIAALANDSLFWLRREAAASEAADEWANALLCLDRLIDVEPTWQYYDRRAHAYVQLGQYARAASDFTRAGQRGGSESFDRDPGSWLEIGMVYLMAGDTHAYREACAKAVARYGKNSGGNLSSLLDLCLLSAEGVEQITNLLPQIRQEVALSPRNPDWLQGLGAALFRTGQAEAAVHQLTAANALKKEAPTTWLFLALAQHRLGHADEARKWLSQAVRWLDDDERPTSLLIRLERKLLRREAEGLLHGSAASPAK